MLETDNMERLAVRDVLSFIASIFLVIYSEKGNIRMLPKNFGFKFLTEYLHYLMP